MEMGSSSHEPGTSRETQTETNKVSILQRCCKLLLEDQRFKYPTDEAAARWSATKLPLLLALRVRINSTDGISEYCNRT